MNNNTGSQRSGIHKMINSIKRLFGLSHSNCNENSIEPLLSFINIRTERADLYDLALRHSSYSIKNNNGMLLNNERLEFLGDSILSAAVSTYLYNEHPTWNEGKMSQVKSAIVARKVNNQVGHNLNLQKYIKCKGNLKESNADIYGNTIEALIGAIYLDQGFSESQRFIYQFIMPTFKDMAKDDDSGLVNYKSTLLEWAQKNHLKTNFELVSHTKDDGDLFTYAVTVNGKRIGTGSGKSKKEAHQEASYNALKKLKEAKEELCKANQ